MNNDNSNVRTQDIGPDWKTGGPKECLALLSLYNSFIYNLFTERRGVFSACIFRSL